MYILIFILLLIIIFVLLLFYKAAIIRLNTDLDELTLDIDWIDSFIKIRFNILNNTSYLSIYIFGKRIYSKPVKKRKRKRSLKDRITALKLSGTYADIYYGLNTPFHTGVACGVVQMIRAFLNNDVRISQHPDFVPEKEYFYLKAGTELNIGKTVLNLIKNKNKRRILSWNK